MPSTAAAVLRYEKLSLLTEVLVYRRIPRQFNAMIKEALQKEQKQ